MVVSREPFVHLIRHYDVEEAMLNYRKAFVSRKINIVTTMHTFQESLKEPQQQLLSLMQDRLYDGKKFRPPEYFYVQSKHLFRQRETRPFPTTIFKPSIFPLMGFHQKLSRYDEGFKHRLWLLKPSYYSMIGNSTLVTSKATLVPMSPNPFDVSFSTDELYFHNLSPGDDELKTFRKFFSKTVTSYPEDHSRYAVARSIFLCDFSGKIDKHSFVRTVDIVDHPEFQVFKEHWPIFDWDSLIVPKFQSIIIPTSL